MVGVTWGYVPGYQAGTCVEARFFEFMRWNPSPLFLFRPCNLHPLPDLALAPTLSLSLHTHAFIQPNCYGTVALFPYHATMSRHRTTLLWFDVIVLCGGPPLL